MFTVPGPDLKVRHHGVRMNRDDTSTADLDRRPGRRAARLEQKGRRPRPGWALNVRQNAAAALRNASIAFAGNFQGPPTGLAPAPTPQGRAFGRRLVRR